MTLSKSLIGRFLLLAMTIFILGHGHLAIAAKKTKKVQHSKRLVEEFCAKVLAGIAVLEVGYPDRDGTEMLKGSRFLEVIEQYGQTVVSVGGRYYTRSDAQGLVELRKVADRSLVNTFSVPEKYAIRAINETGELAVITNSDDKPQRVGSILKVIVISTGKVILHLSKPANDIFGVRFGFFSSYEMYAQTENKLLEYALTPEGAFITMDREIADPSLNEDTLKPIPATELLFKYSGWDAPTLLRLSDFRSKDILNSEVSPAGEPPQLDRQFYEEMFERAKERGLEAGMSFEKMSEFLAALAQPKVRDIKISASGKLAVFSGNQGMGDDNGGGNFESFLIVLDLKTFRTRHTIFIPKVIANQVTISADDRYLAWAGPEGLGVFDLQDRAREVYSDLSGNWLGAYVKSLEWSGPHQLVTADTLGRVVRRDLELK